MTSLSADHGRRCGRLLPICAAALVVGGTACLAQSTGNRAVPEPLARALEQTQATGQITVAVAPRLAEALRTEASRRDLNLEEAVQLVGVLPDAPSRPLKSQTLGEIRVYRAGPKSPELMARLESAATVDQALEWLQSLPAPDAKATRDDEVARTNHWHHAPAPSPQAPQAPPPPAPQPQYMVAQPTAAVPQAAFVQAPAPQPVVVQTPAPSILLQQSAPTIYLAQPPQPANIQILAAPSAAPTVSVLQPSVAVAPAPSQLFLAAPAAAPAPAPTAIAYAAAPAPALVAAPSAALTTSVREVQPGLLGRMIGGMGESMLRIGDKLAHHKNPRLVTQTHAVPTAAVQYAAPAAVPYAAPPAYQAVPAAAPPSYASPQYGQASGHHGLFHKR